MRIASRIATSTLVASAICVAGCHDTTAPVTTIAIVPVPTLTAQNSVTGTPPGWIGFIGQPASFTVGVESANAHSGARAAFLINADSVESGATFADIGQLVRADSYIGHRLRWSGWVRSTQIELPYAAAATAKLPAPVSGLWMRIDGRDSSLAFDNMQLDPVVGTSDWHYVSVVLDVPANAVGIAFGALFSGTGQLLVDDFALDVVDATVPTTNTQSDPRSSPNIGAAYLNAPEAPANLGFETVSQTSASLRRPKPPANLIPPSAVTILGSTP